MKISELFGLNKTQYELDFVDIDIGSDTPLFLDPYFISKQDFSFAEEAYKSLKNYFETLLYYLRNGKKKEAKEIFSYLGETNELCLGLSKGKPSGKGMGPTDANRIFDSLVKSKAFETGLMEDIEDCRIFVPNVDRDKISDMTANIIKKHLIEYTQAQCKIWEIELTKGVASGYYWDRELKDWNMSFTEMLVIDDHKYILVPKRVVSFSKEYTSEKYYKMFVLTYMQSEHLRLQTSLVRQRADKSEYVTKKDIMELDIKRENTDKKWLAEFTLGHPEVFADFKEKTIQSISPANNEDLCDVKASEVAEYLKRKLFEIPTGKEYATEYQRVVLSILEFLFYPQLSVPRIEDRLHNGRKRVDITFDNCANSGFFERLTHDMPCRIIMVECKNYKDDISNPEADQLSGRFSKTRGMFGISACRKIDDMELFISRCADTLKDGRGLIIPLVDEDFGLMLNNYGEKGVGIGELVLQDKYHKIAMK